MELNLYDHANLTGWTLENGIFLTNNCTCPGHNLTFECSVNGVVGGSTVWSGNAIRQCMVPIFLRHRDFTPGTSRVCNNGDMIIRSLRAESNCYVSQMNILFSANLNGSTVACAYDNGTATVGVGSMSIMAIKKCTNVTINSTTLTAIHFPCSLFSTNWYPLNERKSIPINFFLESRYPRVLGHPLQHLCNQLWCLSKQNSP